MKNLFDKLINLLLILGAPALLAAFMLYTTVSDLKNGQPGRPISFKDVPIFLLCMVLGIISMPFAIVGYGFLYLSEEVFHG